jgi:hypothetical protein
MYDAQWELAPQHEGGTYLMANLFQFLADLATDPDKQEKFRDNPEAAMDEAGLSESEKNVITKGDKEAIVQHLGEFIPLGWSQPVTFDINELTGQGIIKLKDDAFEIQQFSGVAKGQMTQSPQEEE